MQSAAATQLLVLLALHNRAIIVNRLVGRSTATRQRVVSKARIVVVTQFIRLLLALQERRHLAQPIQAPRRMIAACSTADRVQRQNAAVEAHPDELVRRIARVVSVLRRRVLHARVQLGRGVLAGAPNDFGNQVRAKWRQARQHKVAIGAGWELGQRGRILEVVH